MDLKINDNVVGTVYFVIKLDLTSLGFSKIELSEKIKNQEFKVTLGDKEFLVKSYRRMYVQENAVCIEGAELQ